MRLSWPLPLAPPFAVAGLGLGAAQQLRRAPEGGGGPDGSALRAQTTAGQQGHLPPGGLRRQVHGRLQEVHGGRAGWDGVLRPGAAVLAGCPSHPTCRSLFCSLSHSLKMKLAGLQSSELDLTHWPILWKSC